MSEGESIDVLHVDDDPNLADLAADMLEREDDRFTVATAGSANEGIDKLTDIGYDCIVSDYDMPGQTGIEFLQTVREDYPELPFILFTGKGSEEVASEAISAGVTDYLQKESGTDQYTLLTNRIRNAVGRQRAEQERAEIRERMELALRETNSVTFEIDVETGEVSRHGAVEQFFDVPLQELSTKAEFAENAVHPEDRDRFRAFFQQLRERDKEYDVFDFRTHPKIDTVRWIRGYAHHIYTDGAEQIIGLAQDISERKERENTLRQRERRYKAIFNDPNVLTGVLDNDGTLLEANQRALDYIDATASQVIGDPIWETPWWDAETRPAVRRKVEQAAGGEYTEYEADLTKPDGEPYSVTGQIRPVTDESGAVTSLIISARDITERKHRERELQRYEAYLEESTDIITVLDESGTITYESPAVTRILGYDADELVGVNGFDLMHPDDVDEVSEVFADLVTEPGATVTVDCRFKTADDEWRWIEVSATNRLEHEAIEGIVTNNRDISEQKERERRYDAIFNNTYQFTGLMEPDGTLVEANETALEFGGLDRADVVGEKLWNTEWFQLSEETEEIARQAVDRAAKGEFARQELQVQGADREAIIDFSVRPITDDEGNVTRLVPEGRDITERKQREQELHRYQRIVEDLDDVATIIDSDGEITYVSPSVRRVLGYEPEELLGENGFRYQPTETSAAVADAIEDVLENPDETRIVQTRFRRADGTWCWIESTLRNRLDEEMIDGILVSSRDITERKRRSEQLEALLERSQMLMAANTSDRIAEVGVEAAREVLGLELCSIHLSDTEQSPLVPVAATDTLSDLIGDPPVFRSGESIAWRVYDAEEALALDDVRDDPDTHNPETPMRSELYFPLGDHGIMLVGSPTADAFTDNEFMLGRILAANIVSALDQVSQTERLRAREAELRRQNERLEQFSRVLSHDLRNPLTVAEGKVELASEECDSEHLGDVARAHDRIRSLIEDLLSVAREADADVDLAPVTLGTLVDGCWKNVETRDAKLVKETDVTIQADKGRLKRLAENLIRNAIEHGGTDVRVTVGELDDGYYIEDDGGGIPPAQRDRVFDAGYSTNEDGTGFGLSIVEQVVEAHGWEISVTEGAAGGARFEITGVEFAR